jgi:hypothetical protein
VDISSAYGIGRATPGRSPVQNRQTLPGNSNPAPASMAANAGSTKRSDAAQAFLDYTKKTPEQRFQEAWLKAHGITPEQFAAMSPTERQKILDQIRQEIQAKVKENAQRPKKPTNILV